MPCPSRNVIIGLPASFSRGSWQAISDVPAQNTSGPQATLAGRRRTFNNIARTSSGKLIDGICKGLEALLLATNSRDIHPASGCRSLFSTCLRQVPKFIAKEETSANIDDPDNDLDISSEVYNDLEAIGPVPSGGWKPLRHVVRAHGLDLIGTAVLEGLLEPTVTGRIVALCLRLGAYDEGQRVLECMTASSGLLEKPTLDNATRRSDGAKLAFASISDFAARTRKYAFLYRQTTTMLESGILPIGWVGSKAMIECWNGVIQSIAEEDDNAPVATTLLRTAISRMYQKSNHKSVPVVQDIRLLTHRGNRLQKLRSATASQEVEVIDLQARSVAFANTASLGLARSAISNVLTVLSAINLLETSKPALASQNRITGSMKILQELAFEAGHRLELASHMTSSREAREFSFEWMNLPSLAGGLSSFASRRSLGQLSLSECKKFKALSALTLSNESVINASSFLCTVAHCCARARSQDAFDCVQVMARNLLDVASYIFPKDAARSLCARLTIATAFTFSEETSQPEHLDWALKVESALNDNTTNPSKHAIGKTPNRGTMQSKLGYRWEEGICEWIAKTPAVALQKPSASAVDLENEVETAETSSSSHEQELPLLSQRSPSIIPHRPSKDTGRPACGQAEALFVFIKVRAGNCGGSSASEELCSKEIYERGLVKACDLETLQEIYLDDDFDELSTPESSQKQPSAPVFLREIPNVACDAKRKRNAFAIKPSGICKRPLAKCRALDIDTLDMEDELSAL